MQTESRMMYEPIMRLTETCSGGFVAIGQEWNKFIVNRVVHTNDTLASLAQAGTNPVRCMEIGHQFMVDAATDFNDATRRILAIGGRVMQGAVTETGQPIETLRQAAKI